MKNTMQIQLVLMESPLILHSLNQPLKMEKQDRPVDNCKMKECISDLAPFQKQRVLVLI